MSRRSIGVAVLAGLVAGAAAAALRPGEPSPRAAAPGPIRDGAPLPSHQRLPDGRYDPGRVHLVIDRATVKIAVRRRDPAGGPDWALRTYEARRVTLTRPTRTLARPHWTSPPQRCVELGRLHSGRFGWVTPDRRFRPFAAGAAPYPLGDCGPRGWRQPIASFETLLTFPSPAEPQPTGGLLWGLAPRGTTALTATGLGAIPRGPDGAFLVLTGPEVRGAALRLRFGRSGAKPVTWPRAEPRPQLGGRSPKPIPGTARVEARAPDPAGGAPWGIVVVDTTDGGTCAGGPTTIVGDRGGGVDPLLGVLTEGPVAPIACRPRETRPTPERPVDVGTGFGRNPDAESDDPVLHRARTERRLQPGRFSVHGEAHPDVVRVTIRTPRDVRTLVPSARGHVFFALYDGDFPAGEVIVTAYLKNGRTFTQRMPAGF